MESLIDQLLPDPHLRMRHVRRVAAPPAVVYQALHRVDLAGSHLVRLLLWIRTLRRPEGPLTLARLTQAGFGVVGEAPGREIVLGVTGKFWRPSGERRAANREQFRAGAPAGEVLVAWNFLIEGGGGSEEEGGTSRLTTETRILAGDPATLRTFRRYWRLVHPGSALIRRAMLRAVAREATRPA